MTYSAVNWDSSSAVNITINGGQVTGTNTTSTYYTSNVRSTSSITSTDSVKITNENTTVNDRWVAGLGIDPFSDSPDTYPALEYGWHYVASSNAYMVIESGSVIDSYTGTSNSVAQITRDGTTIKYYLDGVLKRNTVNQTSNDLYAQATITKLGSCSMTTNADQSGGGSGGSGGTAPAEGDGTPLEYILPFNTVVPR